MGQDIDPQRRRGRGATSNGTGRFESQTYEEFDDGWDSLETLDAFQRIVHEENARTIITTNKSPDISFNKSINPYRGCEHGCIYCYARPTHTFLGHSAGLDFETKIYAKPEAASLLEVALSRPGYKPQTIALGTNTDPYQPIERGYKITRQILEVLERASHPVAVVTKSANVTRDIDVLSAMAERGLVKVALSVTTLDSKLARAMEPRASTPFKRIEALRKLSEAGVPTTVMVAPIIPALTDHELERILECASKAGAQEAGYVLLRLPLEIKELFEQWLEEEVPHRAARVINILRSMHGGAHYDSAFGIRQRGRGPYAEQIANRFRLACRKLELGKQSLELRTDLFCGATPPGAQLSLL